MKMGMRQELDEVNSDLIIFRNEHYFTDFVSSFCFQRNKVSFGLIPYKLYGSNTFGEGKCSKEIMHLTAYPYSKLDTKRKHNLNVDINTGSFISKRTVLIKERKVDRSYISVNVQHMV